MVHELAYLSRLLKNQWATASDLRESQSKDLSRLLEYAYDNVPFYKSLYDRAGCRPSDVRNVDDIARLPIITKKDLQEAGSDLHSRKVDLTKCVWLTTSGSMGTPLKLPFTRQDKDRRVLRELRALLANGYRLTDRMMLVIEPRWVIEHNKWFQKLGVMRRKCLSLYESPVDQYRCLKEWKPQVLYGYTSGVHVMADELAKLEKTIPSLKLVVTSAEIMEPTVRRNLKQAFGITPTDFYGSMEQGWIGWECPEHKGYHMNTDCLVIECLKDGRPVEPGEEGEFVITSLHAFAAPLIRYATGDLGTISDKKCKCGRSLPLISTIQGRVVDRIILPSGESISPYMLTCAIEDVLTVQRFQIVQESIDRIVVNLVIHSNPEATINAVTRQVQDITGPGVQVIARIVDDIERERSGKFKAVKSVLGRQSAIPTGH